MQGVLYFMRSRRSPKAIEVREDNRGAIKLANNPLSSARSRHIDVRHHFLRELVNQKRIIIRHVESKEQHADALTKPLEIGLFTKHRNFLLNCD